MKKQLHPVVKLAKEAVESYIEKGTVLKPEELTTEMKERSGVFVSIKKRGELKGCIGTFQPTRANIAEEIIANAISSATRDPRFTPVTVSELDKLEYSVDILTPPEPVGSNLVYVWIGVGVAAAVVGIIRLRKWRTEMAE